MSGKRAETGSNGLAELKPVQEAAAVALAGGATLEQAARRSGAGLTTIKTWITTEPGFKRRIRELRADLTDRILGKLATAGTSAVNTLLYLSTKGKTQPIRLKASSEILSHLVKFRESVDLEELMQALEAGRRP